MASSGALDWCELAGVQEIKSGGSKTNAGSYGFVFEVKLGNDVFMAKKPHTIFTECAPEERNRIAAKFREECILLSQLKHPNIVKFIGVYYGDVRKTDLILVMEKLHCDLVQFLGRSMKPDLSLKLSILQDVATGLAYLHGHSPPVVHRDLTAMNVLLTESNQAKIADVGMAKLMDRHALMASRHTRVPGQQYYMPPEALFEKAECTPKLDIFSFGHLTLHLMIGKFPEVYEIPHANKRQGIIEQQKRHQSLQIIGSDHCLYDLTLDCLRDDPNLRPKATQLIEFLQSKNARNNAPPELQAFESSREFKTEECDSNYSGADEDSFFMAAQSIPRPNIDDLPEPIFNSGGNSWTVSDEDTSMGHIINSRSDGYDDSLIGCQYYAATPEQSMSWHRKVHHSNVEPNSIMRPDTQPVMRPISQSAYKGSNCQKLLKDDDHDQPQAQSILSSDGQENSQTGNMEDDQPSSVLYELPAESADGFTVVLQMDANKEKWMKAISMPTSDNWICDFCTFINSNSNTVCGMCGIKCKQK